MNTLMGFKDSLRSTLLGLCALAALGVGSARAASTVGDFDDLMGYPDIKVGLFSDLFLSGSFTTGYNASTDILEVRGDTISIQYDGSTSFDIGEIGGFVFDATISSTGVASAATMTISGSFNSYNGTLLEATLASAPALGLDTVFAFDTSPDQMAFLLSTTGGVLQSQFSPLIIFLMTPGGDIDFSTNFSGANGSGDVAGVVPIPAAAWLFASALGLGGLLRRRATQA